MAYTLLCALGFEVGSIDIIPAANRTPAQVNISPTGHTGTYSLGVSGVNAHCYFPCSPVDPTELYWSGWIKLESAIPEPQDRYNSIWFMSVDGLKVGISMGTDSVDPNTIVYDAVVDGTIVDTGSIALDPYVYTHVELYVKIDDTVGKVISKINGVADVSFTGDTVAGYTPAIVQVSLENETTRTVLNVDDMLFGEGDWMPNLVAIPALPIGDAASASPWTRSNALLDYHEHLDIVPPDDVLYLSTTDDADDNYFDITNIDLTGKIVDFVSQFTRAEKDDASDSHIIHHQRIGGSDVASADLELTTSYAYQQKIWLTNPSGGAWSNSDIPNLELGIESDI